jgi:hypothetical protein
LLLKCKGEEVRVERKEEEGNERTKERMKW